MKKLLLIFMLFAKPAFSNTYSTDISSFPINDMYKRHDATVQPVYHSSKKGEKLLEDVNNYYNWNIKYYENNKNYWQTPEETNSSKQGDCKDIAIAKWQALLDNGISETNMFFVVGFIRGTKKAHAILMVRKYGNVYYLDNNSPILLRTSPIDENNSYIINRFGYSTSNNK